MSKLLATFRFAEQEVRIVMMGGQPWWIATDLALLLGYRNAPDMIRMLDEDQKGTHEVRTLGGLQSVSIISESGMWTCVLRSQRPEAKAFVRYLTDEILPALRRDGFYLVPGSPAAARFEAARIAMARKHLPETLRRLHNADHPTTHRINLALAKADCDALGIEPPTQADYPLAQPSLFGEPG